MRQARKADLLRILVCVALLVPFCDSLRSNSFPVSEVSHSPKKSPPPATLRWSTREGCFADSDFYFELRTDARGANWTGVLVAYGDTLETLIERKDLPQPIQGNYLARGRLDEQQTLNLLSKLRSGNALEIKGGLYSTAPILSVYLELDGRSNKVANFQDDWESPDSPESQFSHLVYSGFFSQVRQSLESRWKAGETPDYPLDSPAPKWLQKESLSLFAQYPKS